ncbi:unnamed protein product [Effrenium voratum]|nr:unnamed protein product [Effrenium voratum]
MRISWWLPILTAGSPEELWAGLQHATGFSNAELAHLAKELQGLEPSQRELWQRKVRCTSGTCAPEAASRLVAGLGETGRLPARVFELFPGDPLYEYWKESDRTGFHSWVHFDVDEEAEESLEALIPEGQPLASSRLQASNFTWRAKRLIRTLLGPASETFGSLGRCLEWDTPFYIIKAFARLCFRFDILQYADSRAGLFEDMKVHAKGTRLMSLDVLHPPSWMPNDYGLVVCLFVLEHVPDPHLAMKGIASLLHAGGFLLLGAPFVDGVHGCPDDFFRYTPRGLRRVAEVAGLEASPSLGPIHVCPWLADMLQVLLEFSPGNAAAAAGELMGMRSSYWSTEDLLRDSDTHPVNVFLLARKPLRPGHRRPWARHNATR